MGFAIASANSRWPNGRIPYEIDENAFPPGSAERAMIDEAIAHWNTTTVISLAPRTNEAQYVVFAPEDGSCHSDVGMQRGGPGVVGCDVGNGFDAGSVIHEIGHAVGLWHEHQRPDQDDFVTINWDNIPVDPDTRRNFDVRENGVTVGDYDYASIMHYSESAFAVNEQEDTITPAGGHNIGQRVALSPRDVWTVGFLYGQLHSAIVWRNRDLLMNQDNVFLAGLTRSGRRFAGDVVVNDVAAGSQRLPGVGTDAQGGIVVVWEDERSVIRRGEIKTRGFEPDGRQRFAEFTVNAVSIGQQVAPAVAVAADGSFLVVWQDDPDQNGLFQVRVRGFFANGNERFPTRTVNSQALGQQRRPGVAVAADGGFVVVWEDDANQNGLFEIMARGFSPDGAPRFADFRVNTVGAGEQLFPDVACAQDGRFVVVWQNQVGDGGQQIMVRGFEADGTERFDDFVVNAAAGGRHVRPSIAVSPDGAFVVAWQDDTDGNESFQIHARSFAADGAPRNDGQQLTVNTNAAGQQRAPRISVEPGGNFVVIWHDDPHANARPMVFARAFDDAGEELFTSVRVGRVPAFRQVDGAVSVVPT